MRKFFVFVDAELLLCFLISFLWRRKKQTESNFKLMKWLSDNWAQRNVNNVELLSFYCFRVLKLKQFLRFDANYFFLLLTGKFAVLITVKWCRMFVTKRQTRIFSNSYSTTHERFPFLPFSISSDNYYKSKQEFRHVSMLRDIFSGFFPCFVNIFHCWKMSRT